MELWRMIVLSSPSSGKSFIGRRLLLVSWRRLDEGVGDLCACAFLCEEVRVL